MIFLSGVDKKFNNRNVLTNVSFSLPEKGLVALLGKSGSGKSTLIKIIGGLVRVDVGKVKVKDIDLTSLNDENLAAFRLKNIGIIFQSYNLLNLDTVENNISLAIDALKDRNKRARKARIKRISKDLGIDKLLKRTVNTLSGGEKQRVAIARALINSPSIILCDEPTGSLDEDKKDEIYKILKTISENVLVVVASHDKKKVKEIADEVIEIQDGRIIKNELTQTFNKEETKLRDENKVEEKSHLPTSYIARYLKQNFKYKKYRLILTNILLSVSLLGIGTSIVLSTNLSDKISNVFASLINSNQIIMQRKNSINSLGNVYSASKEDSTEIYNKYSNYIERIGVSYIVNFENFFKDQNVFYISSSTYRYEITSLSVRNINDYKIYNSDSTNRLYPRQILDLEDDEVVLALTYNEMVNICYHLKISRDFISLGEYLENNDLRVNLAVANSDWQYDDEQTFTVRAVSESNSSAIYHTNPMWNEVVFEEMMLLPSIDSSDAELPWEMQKVYYFETYSDPKTLLDLLFFDSDYENFIFERLNYHYSPNLCKIGEVCGENRVLVFTADMYSIPVSDIEMVRSLYGELTNYIYCTSYGYSSYSASMMNGFSSSFYVSNNEASLEEVIDLDSYLDIDETGLIDLPEYVYGGNYLYALNEGVSFSTLTDDLIVGRKPTSLSEIVISTELSERLFGNSTALGERLYMTSVNEETIEGTDKLIKNFVIEDAVIVGIVDSSSLRIYHDSNWSISFFRDKIGVSSFSLTIDAVIFEFDASYDTSNLLAKLKSNFVNYEFVSPTVEINNSLNEISSYLSIILLVFSIASLVIAILFLSIVVYLNIIESKNAISSLRQVGLSTKNISRLFIYSTLIIGLFSFFVASIELGIIDYFLSLTLNNLMGTSTPYYFSIYPLLILFCIVILVAIIIPFLVTKHLIKKI